MIQFNTKDTHHLLEWVSKAHQFFLIPLRYYIIEENVQVSRKNMEQISSKQCLTPFAWNISQAWAPTSQKLLTGIWLLISLSVKLPIPLYLFGTHGPLGQIYLLPFVSLPAVSYRENKWKYSQHVIVTCRNETTCISHEKKLTEKESRSCATISILISLPHIHMYPMSSVCINTFFSFNFAILTYFFSTANFQMILL